MKIIFINNTSDSVINFRLSLIKKFLEEGWQVSVICGDACRKEEIMQIGCDFYCVEQNNRSLNPFSMKKYEKGIKKIIKQIRPDMVFTFQLKPNIFGVKAAKNAGVNKIFSMVEGAGDVFINNGLKWKIIRSVVCLLYKKSLKHAEKIFFLNHDDENEFIERKLAKRDQCTVIHGIGVDLEKFQYKPLKNYNVFLMIARMLKTKGVMEYCECARIVKQKYPDAVFNYLGSEGTVKIADIQEYIDDGSINYLGKTKDVRPYLEDCSVFVLPSCYREGVPMSIMEAESVGRAIITYDNIGCRETVIDGYNGFLIDKNDFKTIAEKMILFIEHKQKVELMGKNARAFAQEKFNQKNINKQIFKIIQEKDEQRI